MFFIVMMAILGTGCYVGRYVSSRRQDKKTKQEQAVQIRSRTEADRRFSALCTDVEGSIEFRKRFPTDWEYAKKVCEEGTEILRNILGLKDPPTLYPTYGGGSGRYLLAAFLHFIPTGKAYDYWVIAKGPNPFGMSMEDAEKVMLWGEQELRKRGMSVRICKTWDGYNDILYGWTLPIGAKRWCTLEDQEHIIRC